MTPERWKQIEELYHAALKLEPGQRTAFLKEACAADEDLLREVESLLAHEPQGESFIEASALEGTGQAMAENRGQPLVGRQLGVYKILSLLGAGGMGEVYKAQDTRLNRIVAIKVLPRHLSERADLRQRFEQEARALASLSHPHICPIHVIGKEDGIDFLVMEYVAGKTLDELIPRKGLRSNEVLKYAIQIADAIATAHAASIVHRDLKPGNIMVSENGQVKVLDFGLAKLSEKTASQEPDAATLLASGKGPRTEEGTVLGTVSYMSPEQAEGKSLDARSDIFSFGLVLYEMVTGQKAFTGESNLAILTAILREEPKPASQIVGDSPPDLEKIINRCLRKDRERRFQHMADIKVTLQELKEESDSGLLARTQAAVRPARRNWVWAAAAMAVVAMAVAGWLFRGGPRKLQVAPEVLPLTSYAGSEQSPSFSPDGNQVAFSWNGEKQDNFDIYIKLIGSPTPVRLTTDPAEDVSPAFSPDGGSIGFVRRTKERSAFVIIPSIGGPERIVAEVPNLGLFLMPSFAWFPEGKWVVTQGLALLSIETGETRRLTIPPTKEFVDVSPAVSPDGQIVAFSRSTSIFEWNIYLLDLTKDLKANGEPRQLTFLKASSYTPIWTPNGREIIFTSGYGGSLWRVAVSGQGDPERLPFTGGEIFAPAISRSGNRLAYQRDVSDRNIWRLPLSGSGAAVGAPARFIASTRADGTPQYSPDGRHIAFSSNRTGVGGIWVCDADGSNAVELFSQAGKFSASTCWSPDGQRVAFDSNLEGNMDIYVIRASGGKPVRLTTDSADDNVPSWSRDGNWIYFTSQRGGRREVWKMPAGGGEAVQVTKNGGFSAVESLDGKSVYYTKGVPEASMALWRMPVSGGEESQVLPSVVWRAFSLVDDGIYFIPDPGADGKSSIQFLTFATGKVKKVASIPGAPDYGLTVSPDRRHLLYTQVDEAGSDLMLVENFR